MNGCICCTVRGDLVKVLKRLKSRLANIDGVIIETTGLADPAPVAQTFFVDDEVSASYKLDGIITVVDAKHIMEHLKEEKPEGEELSSRVRSFVFCFRISVDGTTWYHIVMAYHFFLMCTCVCVSLPHYILPWAPCANCLRPNFPALSCCWLMCKITQ